MTYIYRIKTVMTHLHHHRLEKDLDPTMVNPDVVVADKEVITEDDHKDHGLRTAVTITTMTILIDFEVE